MIGNLRKFAHATVLTVALLVTACASPRFAELDGTQWKLTAWKWDPLELENTPIRLAFSGGRMSGFGGVNGYQGAYKTTSGGRFCAGACGGAPEDQGTVTLLGSNDPEGKIARSEDRYLDLLFEAVAYKFRGDRLTLYDSLGTETLTFVRVSP